MKYRQFHLSDPYPELDLTPKVPLAKNAWCDRCDDLQKHYGGHCLICHPNYSVICRECGAGKPKTEYAGNYGGRYCRPCLKKRQENDHRRFFLLVKNYAQKTYASMRRRCHYRTGEKYYRGLKVLAREEFYRFALHDPNLPTLIRNYIDSGYQFRLAPSINRIDSKLGYIINNIEFIALGENGKLGAISMHRKLKP